MVIRELTNLEECRQVAALERDVWGYADAEDVVPPPVLTVSIKRGGILIGGFDERGAMKGFVYSIPAVKNGRLTQWSHMLGVAADARESGLGRRLKLAQRERALAMGIDLPTDRFVAEWRLTAPQVERRIAADGMALIRDAGVGSAPLVNPSIERSKRLEPGPADLSLDARRLLVEIPVGYSQMLVEHPALALEWRLAARAIFQHYFSHGYRAVDFFLSRAASRGHYLLAPEP